VKAKDIITSGVLLCTYASRVT